MCVSSFNRTLRRACIKEAVMPFTPHQLRGGAKLEVVSRILGHAGVGVTADIYRHVATEELHEEHSRFAPFNGAKVLPEG